MLSHCRIRQYSTAVIVTPRYATREREHAPETAKAPFCDEVSGLRYYNPAEGRWLNRDPIGEYGGDNVYCFVGNSPIEQNDDTGEKPLNYQEYYNQWVLSHPGLSDAQYAWVVAQLRTGCVGVTIVSLGWNTKSGMPDMSNCFNKRGLAKDAMKKDCGCGSKPQMFSIHLWNNDKGRDGVNPSMSVNSGTGKVDLSNWNYKRRPSGGLNFDFGLVLPDGEIVHANHSNQPPADEMQISSESLAAWKLVGWFLPDYNAEVWCVACDGGKYVSQ